MKSKELAYIIFKNIFKIKIMIEYSPRYSSEPLILISKLTVWISQNQEPELNHLRPVLNWNRNHPRMVPVPIPTIKSFFFRHSQTYTTWRSCWRKHTDTITICLTVCKLVTACKSFVLRTDIYYHKLILFMHQKRRLLIKSFISNKSSLGYHFF